MQHRVATLVVQHSRRHQNHPTGNPFLKSYRFRLCLARAAVVNLFVLNLVCFISVCPCIPETGRLENTYSSCGFWLWSWLAAVVTLFVLNLLCFISFCLYPKRADCRRRTYREGSKKKTCPVVQGTWLHVGPFLAGVLTQRFSTQPLELYIPRLSRCTTQELVSCSEYRRRKPQNTSPGVHAHRFECGDNKTGRCPDGGLGAF